VVFDVSTIVTSAAKGLGISVVGSLSPGPLLATIFFVYLTSSHFLASHLQTGLKTILTLIMCAALGKMGIETLSTPATLSGQPSLPSKISRRKLLTLGAINPGMGLFWGTIGDQIAAAAYLRSPFAAVAFLLSFYLPTAAITGLTICGAAALKPRIKQLWRRLPRHHRPRRAINPNPKISALARALSQHISHHPTGLWLRTQLHQPQPQHLSGALFLAIAVWVAVKSF
jgi:hypothetical protein